MTVLVAKLSSDPSMVAVMPPVHVPGTTLVASKLGGMPVPLVLDGGPKVQRPSVRINESTGKSLSRDADRLNAPCSPAVT
jgi:hypothetical protein